MSLTDLITTYGSPLYVYDEAILRERCRTLRAALPDARLLFAAKANGNPSLLRIIGEEGLGIDAVSLGEVLLALHSGFDASNITYTGNNGTDQEFRGVVGAGVQCTVDSLSQLDRLGRLFPGQSVGIRINPDVGGGHHDHVITGGPEAKFGIEPRQIPDAVAVARRHRMTIVGLQQHVGSGILDVDLYVKAMEVILEHARQLDDLQFVDFGGGFGIPYREDEKPFDIGWFGLKTTPLLEAFCDGMKGPVEFRFEPGRWIVGPCGQLLVTVTDVKRAPRHTFVGTDSGMNHLVRPCLYGSYHHIKNLSRPEAGAERVTIVGNICESGDVFARDRSLPMPKEGDILAIQDAGAYGWSMASTYNQRPRPAEVLLSATGPRVIRAREELSSLWP